MFDPAYPRPQFVRNQWASLDGTWSFSFDQADNPRRVTWDKQIQAPFPPESPRSGIADTSYHPIVWYQRNFTIPAAWHGQRILLHFGAVDYHSKVWLNGQLITEHEGGHTPFTEDITDFLVEGEQRLVVQAKDDPRDMEKPRGKQDWELDPHAIWYPRTSGIWQPVWLEPVAETHIGRLRITPDLTNWTITVETTVNGPFLATTLDLRLVMGKTMALEVSGSVEQARTTCTFELPDPGPDGREEFLWSPEQPTLFDLTVTLRRDTAVLDTVESYTALRSVEARDGEFYLNGRPYFLQMVLDQGYWPESLLAAPSPEALRQDVELTKALGFNGARKHQKIEDPRYLYWADRLGLLVWEEMPSAYVFSPTTARRLTQEFMEMIERDYNHPSVVAWVPFNESWGVPNIADSEPQQRLVQAMYYLAQALDPTRLIIDNDGWEHVCSSLYTIHDYLNDPEVFNQRYNNGYNLDIGHIEKTVGKRLALNGFNPNGLPIILSEFGGIRLGTGKGWGYQQVETPEQFLASLRPLFASVHGRTLAGFCYTQLTDTFQEQNGLLYEDRRPKVDLQHIATMLAEGRRRRTQS